MKFNKIILSVLAISTLAGCQNSNVALRAVHNSNDTASVNTVKDAVNVLINSHNYTIEVSAVTGPLVITSNMFFTENGFYDDYLGDEYGYCKVDEGVFSFDMYMRKFTASKLLEDENGQLLDSVWNNGLFYSFANLRDAEFASATGTTFNSSAKRVKLTLMNMLHVNQAYFPYVQDVEFKLNGNTVDSLEFNLSVKNGQSYTCKVKNYNTTKIDVLDNYLKTSSYFTPTSTLSKVIDLFSNYNYTRIIYDDETEGFDKIAGYEFYDDYYFYAQFEDYYIAQGKAYNIGVVSIPESYTINYNDQLVEYPKVGSFYCYVVDDENGDETLEVMTSFPINEDPFVPNVYNYPTFLEMFKDSQYLKVSGSESIFYTSKSSCITDFANNFQIADTLNENRLVPTGVYVEYYENGSEKYFGTSGKETVVFKIEVSYYGAIQTIDYIYTDFNTTSVDCITPEKVDSIIRQKIADAGATIVKEKGE